MSQIFQDDIERVRERIVDLFEALDGAVEELRKLRSSSPAAAVINKARGMAYGLTEAAEDLLQAGGFYRDVFDLIVTANEGKPELFRLSWSADAAQDTVAHRAIVSLVKEFDRLVSSDRAWPLKGDDYLDFAADIVCGTPPWNREDILRRLHAESGEAMRCLLGARAYNDATHSLCFTSVCWYGTHYTFTSGLQAGVVRALWEAYESGGHSVSQAKICELIGSSTEEFCLAKVFRHKRRGGKGYEKHPAWGTMIQRAGRGAYRLAPPKSE